MENGKNFQNKQVAFRVLFNALNTRCMTFAPSSRARYVWYLVPGLFFQFWDLCIHAQLNPFYPPFYPNSTHMRKDTRSSPIFPYCDGKLDGA